MKRYTEFINELKSSTYLSAAEKTKDELPNLSNRFKEHGDATSVKEKMDKLYELDEEAWLLLASKDDILSKRDVNKIHPLLLEIEKGGYLMDDIYFWNGAGMTKKSIGIEDWEKGDNNYMMLYGKGHSISVWVDGGDIGCDIEDDDERMRSLDTVGLEIDNFNINGNWISNLHMAFLPRRLAKKLFNSSFFIKEGNQTWRVLSEDIVD